VLVYLIGSLIATAAWVAHRGSERNRRRRKPRPLLVTALMLLAAFSLFAEAGHRQSQHRYSEAIQSLTGRPEVNVSCQRLGSGLIDADRYSGWVNFENGKPTKTAHLDWRTCQDLRSFERNLDAPLGHLTREQITAMHVLTHEAIHLTGVSNEAATECIAIQNDETTATLLGVPAATAAAIPGRYLVETYAHMPDDYWSADCVEDGPLDQTPTDGSWPNSGSTTLQVTDETTDEIAGEVTGG
jgi:hypothetical protein